MYANGMPCEIPSSSINLSPRFSIVSFLYFPQTYYHYYSSSFNLFEIILFRISYLKTSQKNSMIGFGNIPFFSISAFIVLLVIKRLVANAARASVSLLPKLLVANLNNLL